MKRHRRELHVMSELNLTNLLDTAFVLLIAFMLVSPVIKHGVDITLPQVITKPLESKDDTKALTIVIQKQAAPDLPDEVYVDDKRVDMETLKAEITERKALNKDLVIVVDGDQDSRHGTFTEVIATVQACGISRFGISTDPHPQPKKKTN